RCPSPSPAPAVGPPRALHSSPTRRSSDLSPSASSLVAGPCGVVAMATVASTHAVPVAAAAATSVPAESLTGNSPRTTVIDTEPRSEEHTSELQSRENLVCRLLLEKKKRRK